MADDNKYREITRIISYYGPPEWLEKTLANSRVPIQGALNLPEGVYIKSGIIMYHPDAITEAQANGNERSTEFDPTAHPPLEQQPVKTVPFKRPGE